MQFCLEGLLSFKSEMESMRVSQPRVHGCHLPLQLLYLPSAQKLKTREVPMHFQADQLRDGCPKYTQAALHCSQDPIIGVNLN